MVVVIGIIVTVVVGLLLLGVAFVFVQLAIELVKLLLKLLLAAATVGAAGLAGGGIAALAASLHGVTNFVPAALAGGGVAAVAAIFWVRSLFTRAVLPNPALPAPQPFTPPEPSGDEAVRDAWNRAEVLAPEDLTRLRAARHRCARALRAVREDGMDHELRDVTVRIRNHVAALVEETAILLGDADEPEQADLRAKLVHSLEAMGQRAGNAADAHRAARREALDLRHTHVQSEM